MDMGAKDTPGGKLPRGVVLDRAESRAPTPADSGRAPSNQRDTVPSDPRWQ